MIEESNEYYLNQVYSDLEYDIIATTEVVKPCDATIEVIEDDGHKATIIF